MLKIMKRHIALGTALACLGAAGCTPTVAQRGNMVEDYQIKEVTPGVSTKTNVLKVLGSPTTQATFDENVWYYIGQTTEKRGILDPEVKEERIVMAVFDDQGILQSIQDIDRARLDIPFARDKTPTHGSEMTVMQQFMGNLGRFNPQEGNK